MEHGFLWVHPPRRASCGPTQVRLAMWGEWRGDNGNSQTAARVGGAIRSHCLALDNRIPDVVRLGMITDPAERRLERAGRMPGSWLITQEGEDQRRQAYLEAVGCPARRKP